MGDLDKLNSWKLKRKMLGKPVEIYDIDESVPGGCFKGFNSKNKDDFDFTDIPPVKEINTRNKDLRSIENLVIPNTVEKIHEKSFFCATQIKQLVIPKSVKCIGDRAFYMCASLRDVEFFGEVENFHATSFMCTPWMHNLAKKYGDVVHNGKLIWSNKFFDRSKYIRYNIGYNVDSLANSVFRDMYIENISFKDSNITLIPDEAFRQSTINNINFGEKVDIIGYKAFAFANFGKLTIPSNIKFIDKCAFIGASVDNSLFRINEGLEYVMPNAFNGTYFRSDIVLPSTLKYIADDAFSNSFVERIIIYKDTKIIRSNGRIYSLDDLKSGETTGCFIDRRGDMKLSDGTVIKDGYTNNIKTSRWG